jgi:NAD-dependent DNA ligase
MTDSFEELIAEARAKYLNNPHLLQTGSPSPSAKDGEDGAIDSLWAELQEIRQEMIEENTTGLPTQERQQTPEQQRQIERVEQAQKWLRSLDSQTDESAWLEEFATKYESRIEAAIDYLGLK